MEIHEIGPDSEIEPESKKEILRTSSLFLCCFAVDNSESIQSVRMQVQEIRQAQDFYQPLDSSKKHSIYEDGSDIQSRKPATIVLVPTKCDDLRPEVWQSEELLS